MLAVIIVIYKNDQRTITYVQEELCKLTLPHKIFIVNNAATSESDQLLKKELEAELITNSNTEPNLDKRIFVLSEQENLGFAKGNNAGARFALKHFDVQHFLFSNNDLRFISDNLVEKLKAKLDSLPQIALIGPKVIGLDGRDQSPEPYYPFWKRYIWIYWLTPFLTEEKKTNLFQLNYSRNAIEGIHYKIMGSFFMVKAPDFVKCGMMDEHTFLFGEEIILSERLRAIGKEIYFYPEVSILHEHSITISKHLKNKTKLLTQFKNESYYYKKYKKVNRLNILVGRLSVNLYALLKQNF